MNPNWPNLLYKTPKKIIWEHESIGILCVAANKHVAYFNLN